VEIVGSPVLERIAEKRWQPEHPPFALINYKYLRRKYFSSSDQRYRADWVREAIDASVAAGFRPIVSAHPANKTPPPPDVAVSSEEFRDILPRAAVLVSGPSTTVFEALVMGVPTVVYPHDGEYLGEIGEPEGAFEIVRDRADLSSAIRRAVALHGERVAARQRFLASHVSIDPSRSADERIAAALLEIACVTG
jgi:hypothetical protein